MINIEDKHKCCGCTACASICPRNAIDMVPDSMGFQYPLVNNELCIDCGLCDNVCQFNDNYDKSLNLATPLAFAIRHKNLSEVMKSRSGAAFAAISDYVLERGGAVYGAGFAEGFVVRHKRAVTKEQRDEFRGSKYVQSDLTDIFHQVKEDLKNDCLVLFSGTPCQTSGLNAYIGKKLRSNLILVDIVCHSVPAPNVWEDYLSFLETRHKAKIIKVNFRDKETFGWSSHKETYLLNNGKQISEGLYTQLFQSNIILRKSCSNCHFTNLIRPSDITLADYWGWERTDPDFNKDNKGCSLVLCNTEKGIQIFEKVKDQLNYIPAKLENIMQGHLQHPTKENPKRDEFCQYYEHHGFKSALTYFGYIGWKKQLRDFKKQMKARIKRILKR